MDELRLVRRDEMSLIVAGDTGKEFRIVVDETLLGELRTLSRLSRNVAKVSPREIQGYVRSGKSRSEIAELTGAAEEDIERYEEPVLAERRYVLSTAQAVKVRITPNDEQEQTFGDVIQERLASLGATQTVWSAWKESASGWMIAIDFLSNSISHHALWSFDHKKNLLAPLNPDAISLSKQGDVGDRLIPKLRAVDTISPGSSTEPTAFSSGTVQPVQATGHEQKTAESTPPDEEQPQASADILTTAQNKRTANITSTSLDALIDRTTTNLAETETPQTDAGNQQRALAPAHDPRSAEEIARRKGIDLRAIKTPVVDLPDLGQTADLLDALRRRRDERELENQTDSSLLVSPFKAVNSSDAQPSESNDSAPQQFSGTDVTALLGAAAESNLTNTVHTSEFGQEAESSKRAPKGRTSIPSWDDILFGTRSEEDPR